MPYQDSVDDIGNNHSGRPKPMTVKMDLHLFMCHIYDCPTVSAIGFNAILETRDKQKNGQIDKD